MAISVWSKLENYYVYGSQITVEVRLRLEKTQIEVNKKANPYPNPNCLCNVHKLWELAWKAHVKFILPDINECFFLKKDRLNMKGTTKG